MRRRHRIGENGRTICGRSLLPARACLQCSGGPVVSRNLITHKPSCWWSPNTPVPPEGERAPCERCEVSWTKAQERERRRTCRSWPDDMGKITRREEIAGVR